MSVRLQPRARSFVTYRQLGKAVAPYRPTPPLVMFTMRVASHGTWWAESCSWAVAVAVAVARGYCRKWDNPIYSSIPHVLSSSIPILSYPPPPGPDQTGLLYLSSVGLVAEGKYRAVGGSRAGGKKKEKRPREKRGRERERRKNQGIPGSDDGDGAASYTSSFRRPREQEGNVR